MLTFILRGIPYGAGVYAGVTIGGDPLTDHIVTLLVTATIASLAVATLEFFASID